jgi:hypothetical protein
MPRPLTKPYYTVLMHPIYDVRHGQNTQLNLKQYDTMKGALTWAEAYTRVKGKSCHIFKCVAHVQPKKKHFKFGPRTEALTTRCKG